MQLQEIHARLERAGYWLAGMSYDRVPNLATFAAANAITYPLLSDAGSTWLRRLGLVNADMDAEHLRNGVEPRPNHAGLPHPGVIVIGADGRVRESVFFANYRERPVGSTLLDEVLGIAVEAPTRRATEGPVRVAVSADVREWTSYARGRLHVDLRVDAGWHVYVDPVPDGYVPLRVEVTGPDDLHVEAVSLPSGHEHRLPGLPEVFHVLDGTNRIDAPMVFTMGWGAGPVEVRVAVSFQACDDQVCLPPEELVVPVTFTEGRRI